MLYRQIPQAVAGHALAATLITYALWPVSAHDNLLIWLAGIILVGSVRIVTAIRFLGRWPIAEHILPYWTSTLTALAFCQTLMWGLSVFLIWPEETEYRALLTVALAGVIAAGGIMLAVHQRSFLVYCLPIAIPAFLQLMLSGGRLETVLGGLILLYSVMLIFAIHRLGKSFLEGMVTRLQMESLSRTDPLTHIANRRGFDDYIQGIWSNAIRSSQSVGLMIIDIDFFKRYNDHYGHPQGDIALTRLAEILTQIAGRGTDLCARVGGEEFAIVLPSTDLEGAKNVAKQIQEHLDINAIPHESSPFGRLTVSIGYGARIPRRNSTIDDFYQSVDEALYRAKQGGRNAIRAETD